MTYDQIKQQPDKAIIKVISGRCVKVFPPKEPTPGQQKAGIHPQSIILQDEDGNDLLLQLTQQSQHFASDDMGKMFHFQSMPNQRGASDGLSVNRYVGKDGEERVSIKVDRHAHFYEIQEDQSLKSGDSISPPEAKSSLGMIDNKADTKFEPSISSLVALNLQIEHEFELQSGRTLSDARIAQVFIQACQSGLHRKPLLVTTHVVEQKKEAMSVAKLAAQVANGEIIPTDEMIRSAGTDWTNLYDEVVSFLGIDSDKQEKAWDEIRKILENTNQSTSSSHICKSICIDIKSYKEISESL